MAFAQIGDVERHHALQHLIFGHRRLQHIDIADAVLEADDQRAVAAVRGDGLRRFRGGAALDAECDDVRFSARVQKRA